MEKVKESMKMKIAEREKEILKKFLKAEILKKTGNEKSADSMIREVAGYREEIEKLAKEGYIERVSKEEGKEFSEFRITEKGRKKLRVVLCGGVFDIIHVGHIYMLKKAKELGDFLAVVVARDSTVKKRKRIPIVNEKQRVEILNSIKPVDIAFLGDEKDYYKVLSTVKPGIVALGYDQEHSAEEIKREAERRNLKIKVVRIEKYNAELASTREIINKIIREYKA